MLEKINIPFIKYRYIFIAISVICFVASVVVIATKGFNYGIDFEGGAKLAYQFQKPVTEGEVRKALEGTPYAKASVVRFGEKKENRMSIKISLPEEHAKIGEGISAALEKSFGAGSVALEQEETVGPKVGREMRRKGGTASWSPITWRRLAKAWRRLVRADDSGQSGHSSPASFSRRCGTLCSTHR